MLVIGDYKIEKLYLKLDKKLTFTADNIRIPQSKDTPSFIKIDKVFDEIKYLFTFFNEISLKNIMFENNQYHFSFKKNILHISSDIYEITGTIVRNDRLLTAKISQLYIKKEHVTLHGALEYDLNTNHLYTKGQFDGYDIQGDFIAQKLGNHIDFNISSQTFTELKTLVDRIPMTATIKHWIVDNIQAKRYKLKTLSAEGMIGKHGFELNLNTLKAQVLLEDVKIYYKKGLEPILADNLTLNYKHRGLYFDLSHPTYLKRSLEDSKVAITHLGAKAMLLLDLHILTPIDKVLQKVLHAYKIDIPVKHKGEASHIAIKLTIPLAKKTSSIKNIKKKISIVVNVEISNAEVWYKDLKLPIKKASVLFDNRHQKSISVDAVLKKGTIMVGKVKLPVLSGKGKYTNGKVLLSNIHMKSPWYDTKVNGTIDSKRKYAELELNIKKLTIGEKEKIIVLNNRKVPLTLDYDKELKATIPALGLSIMNANNQMVITLSSLKKIKKYISNIGIDFDGGTLKITKKNKKDYIFEGLLKRKKCFFYDKDNLCHTEVFCHGSIDSKGLNFYAFKNRLHYNAKKSRLKLKNINIDLKKLLENFTQKEKQKGKSKKFVILGKNSKLRYGKYQLFTDSYDIEISPKGSIHATGSLNSDIVKFSKIGKNLTLNALRVQDKMLHPLIGFSGLKEGRYTVNVSGNPDKVMNGQIIIEGGVIYGFKAYNNILAFINALPAIATLSNPGFSKKGFKIIEGISEYKVIHSNHFIFKSIYLKGESATIVGQGEINIEKNTINMKLAIQTARELGKIVGNLPLLGYILMGKDKSMTVGLEVTGSLNKPEVKISATQEILTLPLEIIKRTLESPAHIINR